VIKFCAASVSVGFGCGSRWLGMAGGCDGLIFVCSDSVSTGTDSPEGKVPQADAIKRLDTTIARPKCFNMRFISRY
jgi:hypothetical protein